MNILKLSRIAFRNLFRNSRRTLITLCVTAAGFASLAVFAGYIDFTFVGLRELTIRNGFTGSGGTGHIQVFNKNALEGEESYPLEFGISDYEALSRKIETMDRVSFAMPRIEFSGLVSNGEKSVSFLGMGVKPEKEGALLGYFARNKSLRLDNSAYYALQKVPNGVVLGKKMAETLNARIGSGLMLMSATVDGAVNAIDVEVAGVVSTSIKTADSYYLLTHLSTVQQLIQTDKAGKIVIVLNHAGDTIPAMSNLSQKNFLSPDFAFLRWDELAEYYQSVRDLYRIIFSFIGTIVVVIVVLSSTNTMLMATMERVKEIGTLRAMGISAKWIAAIFLLEGFFIGVASVILGLVSQFIVSFLINHAGIMMPPPPGMTTSYRLEVYEFTPALPWIALLIIASTAFSSFVTMRKVKKISIVEALNHV